MVKRNPHAIVEIGGDRYDSWQNKRLFKQVTVELLSNQASQGLFRFFDPKFKLLDKYTSDDGIPPLEMRFYLGLGEDLGAPIFKGILQRTERGDSDTTLRALDMGVKMRWKEGKRTEWHHNIHNVAIIQKMAKRNGLLSDVEEALASRASDRHASIAQDTKNDWEFAIERARDEGVALYVRQDTLFVREPGKVGDPILTLRNKKDFVLLHRFDFTYKIPENHFGRHKVVHRHGRKRGGGRLTGVSEEHPRGHKHNEVTRDVAIHTKSYANRTAHASKALQREHAFVCNVRSIPPLPGVRPDFRDTIAIENVGKLFSGPYLVDKVTHDLTGNDFVTEYQLYRDIA